VTAAALLLPGAALLGVDRYRALGHRVTEEYLLVRSGSLVRRTVALRRNGIIGWRVSQNVFQRTAGLATAIAVTAAGSGAYAVVDVAADRAMELGELLVVPRPNTT
ncbi:MAG TPA: PH domain-containing protein, partial [Pseudonocardiaceae bacterium]